MPASSPPFMPLTGDARPAPRTAFEHALRALLDDLFAALPTWATQVGYHAYDDRWPDVSQAGRLARHGMGEEDAMRLMIDGAFQEEQEARAKYLRARLSSTQLSTYYVGSVAMWDLELEARRRAAARTGAADALIEQRIVGGFGATPGFDQRAHLEAVIAHGTPPIDALGRILFGRDDGP